MKIIISGAGNFYPAAIGALIRLEKEGISPSSCVVSGWNVFTGLALASGYKTDEMARLVKKLTFSQYMNLKPSWWNPFNKPLLKTTAVEDHLSKVFIKQLGEAKIPLSVCLVSGPDKQLISSGTHADIESIDVALGSIAFPGLFPARKIENKLYQDASWAVGLEEFMIGEAEDYAHIKCEPGRLIYPVEPQRQDLIKQTFNLMNHAASNHLPETIAKKTIFVKSDFNGLILNASNSDIDSMINEGYEAADRWLGRAT